MQRPVPFCGWLHSYPSVGRIPMFLFAVVLRLGICSGSGRWSPVLHRKVYSTGQIRVLFCVGNILNSCDLYIGVLKYACDICYLYIYHTYYLICVRWFFVSRKLSDEGTNLFSNRSRCLTKNAWLITPRMKLNEKGTSLIGEVGGESEPKLAKLSAASLPGIPMWAGVHTTETECEE